MFGNEGGKEMKQMRRYWFLGVVVIMALLFAGMTFAEGKKPHPSRDEFKAKALAEMPAMAGVKPNLERNMKKIEGISNFERPAFHDIRALGMKQKGMPQPESLCDPGYYWMGGPTWTSDTDGVSTVWAAGGNLYFADANDPTHPIEMWWGDIGLRVRIHNGYAYIFSYFYTYVFDVSSPLSPSFLAYGPGYAYGFWDAYPDPTDSYLLMTDWVWGDLWVWNIATMEYMCDVWNPNGGWYNDMYVVDDKNVAIVGDWIAGYFDFYYIGGLDCSCPVFLGQIFDADYNTGLVLYHKGYLYGFYETWQYYNYWLFGAPPDDGTWCSMYHVPDVLVPANNYYVGPYYYAHYDTTAAKDAGDYMLLVHYQNRVGLWTPQFETHLNSLFLGVTASYATYDGAYRGNAGIAACGEGGAHFWDQTFVETGKYWTGGYAAGVVISGDWQFVPSGAAGLGIIDNSDPSMPVTYGALWPNDYFSEVWYVAVSPDGNYAYVSDGSEYVWTVDCTDKAHPVLLNGPVPYTTAGAVPVTSLNMAGSYLVVGTTADMELVNVSVPAYPVFADSGNLALADAGQPAMVGPINTIRTFQHPAYPDQVFLGVVCPTTFYTFRYSGGDLIETGFLGGYTDLTDVAIVGTYAYVISNFNGGIYPIAMISTSPGIHFNLDTTGQVPLVLGWSWAPDYCYIVKVNDSMVAASGNNLTYGYPAVFLVDVGTVPMAPALLPPGQLGLMPFDWLTGLTYNGGYVYYATDYFGTGAFVLLPDYDLPVVEAGYPSVTPVIPDFVGGGTALDPTGGWLQGKVTLTAKVSDPSTAITSVVFRFYDGSSWRKITTLTSSTPAGTIGTYTYTWDTSKWIYGVGVGPIRVEVTDSGCNTTIVDTVLTYAINLPPTFELFWDAGCNEPPVGGICDPAGSWVVCGDLCLWIWGYTEPTNEVNNPVDPIDDISQIAYNIDNGANGPWTLVDIPTDGPNPLYVCFDTTLLTDGAHTLYVRVTDDCTLQSQKDIYGVSSWTFQVHNLGPKPYIVDPMAGDLVRGADIRVAAVMTNEIAARPVAYVDFYLDPTNYNDPSTGTYIGTATSADANGEWAISWDASSVSYGDHVLEAEVFEDTICCPGPFITPLVSFNLVSYATMNVTATAAPTTGAAPLSTVLTASVTGGQSPYTYTWAFGDGQTGAGNVTSHTYTTAGNYTATVTVTDNTGATATGTVSIVVTGPAVQNPTISSVVKATSPFRLKVYGTNFKPGAVVKINGVPAPYATTFKNSTYLVAKKGAALKALCPKGVTVSITVENTDGGVSAAYSYTR